MVISQGYNAPFIKADVCIAHGTMRGFKIATEGKNAKWHFNQWFEKIAMSKAKKVLAVSQKVKEEILEFYGVNDEKINVIETCVDTNKFIISDSYSEGTIRVLFSGRLTSPKNPDRLLSLAKKIEQEKDMEFVIATPTSDNVDLFAGLTKTKIEIGLSVNDMPEFYNKGDILFFPSNSEGFGLVMLESLACGVPVLASYVGGTQSLIEKKVDGVFLIQSENDDIRLIRSIVEKYKKHPEARYKLHDEMVAMYGKEQYFEKLRHFIKEYECEHS